jgi:hypothetical protein
MSSNDRERPVQPEDAGRSWFSIRRLEEGSRQTAERGA